MLYSVSLRRVTAKDTKHTKGRPIWVRFVSIVSIVVNPRVE